MLTLLTLNHRHASVAERAGFLLSEGERTRFYRQVRRTCRGQAVYLSTCNRVEVITWIPVSHRAEATGLIRRIGHWFFPALAGPYLDQASVLFEREAVSHLFRVAGGVESQVMGDIQVLGQVRGAYLEAVKGCTVGPELHRLFQTAMHTGRRIQREGGMGRSTAGRVAAEELLRRVGPGRIVIVGAGETGVAAAERLAPAGAEVIVLNRTLERAQRVAGRLGATARPFENRYAEVAAADGVIVATHSTEPVIATRELSLARRKNARRLEVFDLSAQSGCDLSITELAGITLTTLDDLPAGTTYTSAAVDALISDGIARFDQWLIRRASEWVRVA